MGQALSGKRCGPRRIAGSSRTRNLLSGDAMVGYPVFEILIKGSIPDALQRVRDTATKEGVQFTGDTKDGNFSGSGVFGYYTVSANIVSIKITRCGSSSGSGCGRVVQGTTHPLTSFCDICTRGLREGTPKYRCNCE